MNLGSLRKSQMIYLSPKYCTFKMHIPRICQSVINTFFHIILMFEKENNGKLSKFGLEPVLKE